MGGGFVFSLRTLIFALLALINYFLLLPSLLLLLPSSLLSPSSLQAFVVNASRLHIPVSWHNEVLLAAAPEATNFPLPVTLGASFNRTLVEAVHEIIAAETRATGADIGYAPEVYAAAFLFFHVWRLASVSLPTLVLLILFLWSR